MPTKIAEYNCTNRCRMHNNRKYKDKCSDYALKLIYDLINKVTAKDCTKSEGSVDSDFIRSNIDMLEVIGESMYHVHHKVDVIAEDNLRRELVEHYFPFLEANGSKISDLIMKVWDATDTCIQLNLSVTTEKEHIRAVDFVEQILNQLHRRKEAADNNSKRIFNEICRLMKERRQNKPRRTDTRCA